MALIDDDQALVVAALNGSAHAWGKLVRRHETRIYNYGLRLTGNSSDALDLMQEVFLGVYRNLYRFRGDAKFTTWLFRIAHNKAIDLNRRRALISGNLTVDGEELLESTEAAEELRPDNGLVRDRSNSWIRLMLAHLPFDQRLVVELKIFQSLTFEEIAAMQDISENTAKTRFYTAMRKLKVLLETTDELRQDPASVD